MTSKYKKPKTYAVDVDVATLRNALSVSDFVVVESVTAFTRGDAERYRAEGFTVTISCDWYSLLLSNFTH